MKWTYEMVADAEHNGGARVARDSAAVEAVQPDVAVVAQPRAVGVQVLDDDALRQEVQVRLQVQVELTPERLQGVVRLRPVLVLRVSLTSALIGWFWLTTVLVGRI